MARSMSLPTESIIELLDAPTTAPAWPKNGYVHAEPSKEMEERRKRAKADEEKDNAAEKGPASTSTPESTVEL